MVATPASWRAVAASSAAVTLADVGPGRLELRLRVEVLDEGLLDGEDHVLDRRVVAPVGGEQRLARVLDVGRLVRRGRGAASRGSSAGP